MNMPLKEKEDVYKSLLDLILRVGLDEMRKGNVMPSPFEQLDLVVGKLEKEMLDIVNQNEPIQN